MPAFVTGQLAPPRAHYVWNGYYEGRVPEPGHVDVTFYLSDNPDMREALRAGRVESGVAHYRLSGRHERRPATPGQKAMKREWDKALSEGAAKTAQPRRLNAHGLLALAARSLIG